MVRLGSPLDCLVSFFSVYDVKPSHKPKLKRRLPLPSKSSRAVSLPEAVSDGEPIRDDNNDNSPKNLKGRIPLPLKSARTKFLKGRIPLPSKSARTTSSPEALSDCEPIRDDNNDSSRWRPSLIVCGFLPLTLNSSLIGNGLHDVGMGYTVKEPSREDCLKANISSETIMLEPAQSTRDTISNQGAGALQDGNVHSVGSTAEYSVTDTESATAETTAESQSSRLDELLGSISFETSVERKSGHTKSRAHNDQMELRVSET